MTIARNTWMRIKTARAICGGCVLVMGSTCAAQTMPSNAGAAADTSIKTLERITVRLTDTGEEIRGRLLQLDTKMLVIKVDNSEPDGRPAKTQLDIPLDRVARIDVENRDGLINGILIGAIYVAACARYWCAQGLDDGSSPNPWLGAAVGALVGGVVDAALYKRMTVFTANGPAGAAPLAMGVVVRLEF